MDAGHRWCCEAHGRVRVVSPGHCPTAALGQPGAGAGLHQGSWVSLCRQLLWVTLWRRTWHGSPGGGGVGVEWVLRAQLWLLRCLLFSGFLSRWRGPGYWKASSAWVASSFFIPHKESCPPPQATCSLLFVPRLAVPAIDISGTVYCRPFAAGVFHLADCFQESPAS